LAKRVLDKLGPEGVTRVAKYIEADSRVARFVYENGEAGIRAIDRAAGDLAAAERALPEIKAQLAAEAEAEAEAAAAAKRKAEEEAAAAAKQKADEEAAAAKRKADEEAAAKKKKPAPNRKAKVKPPEPGEAGFQPRNDAEKRAMEMGMDPAPKGYTWRWKAGKKEPYIARTGNLKGGSRLPQIRWDEAAKKFVPVSEQWQSYTYKDFGVKDPCFPPGTIVKTPHGDRKIEELSVGDIVCSFDMGRREMVSSKVAAMHRNWTRRLATARIGGWEVTATRMHAFWVESAAAWMPARAFWPGMTVRSLDARELAVEGVEIADAVSATYNLEIAETHTYFVGEPGILVHNGGGDSIWASTTKQDVRIYQVIERRLQGGLEIEEPVAVEADIPIYGGKTVETPEERFAGHLAEKPDWKAKWKAGKLRIQVVAEGYWDPYETAVWEKHVIEKLRTVNPNIENVANPISEESFETFREQHVPCK
jgi:hypothetical protein